MTRFNSNADSTRTEASEPCIAPSRQPKLFRKLFAQQKLWFHWLLKGTKESGIDWPLRVWT